MFYIVCEFNTCARLTRETLKCTTSRNNTYDDDDDDDGRFASID